MRKCGHAASILVVLMLGLLAAVPGGPPVMAAGIHDPVTGTHPVSEDPLTTVGIGAEQANSDVAIDGLGRVHAVWQDDRHGSFDVMYARSDDGGRSFGPSIRVNNPSTGSSNFYNPRIDVDGLGNPHVAWEDTRNNPTSGLDIYYARSFDGGDSWGPNLKVNSDSGMTLQTSPSIASGSDGLVLVAYVSGAGDSADIYVSASTDGGRSFGDMQRMTDDTVPKRQLNPDITVDPSGQSHIIWTDYRSGDADIYYTYRTAQGSVSPNVKVNDNTGGTAQTSSAITLMAGVPVMVWKDERNGNPDIYFARRVTATSFSTNVRVNDDSHNTNQQDPDIAVDAGGTVCVVWEGLETGRSDIFMANSTDGGATFQSASQVSVDVTAGARQQRPALAAGAEDVTVVTWEDNGIAARGIDVLASYRLASEARPIIIISDDRAHAFEATPATAVAPDGGLHAVWVDNRRGHPAVFHSTSSDGGVTWTEDQLVSSASGGFPALTPDVAVGPDGTVHVVWTDYGRSVPTIRYANDKDRTSGFNPDVRVDDSPAAGFAVNPSLAIAANGSATVAWLDGRDGANRARVSFSQDGGGSWKPSRELPSMGDGVHTPPALESRSDLMAVLYTDIVEGSPRAFVCMAPSVPELKEAIAVEEGGWGPGVFGPALSLDSASDGPVHVAWVDIRGGAPEVWYAAYDPQAGTFATPTTPLEDTSAGPRFMPAIAAGDGGALHIAWLDAEDDPAMLLWTLVPDLAPADPITIASQGDPAAFQPAMAYGQSSLSLVFLEGAPADTDLSSVAWVNGLPPAPTLQSPPKGGWVTDASFDLTVGTGVDPDGDSVLVRFEMEAPGGGVVTRGYESNPRLSITDAQEGRYRWRAWTTDGFGIQATPWWNFTVDLTPPGAPSFHPVPDFTPGTNITLAWDASSDAGGGRVFYRVVASQSLVFNPPYLADSGWIDETSHEFDDLPATTIHYKLTARDEAGNMVDAPSTVSSTQDNELPKLIFKVTPALKAEEGEDVTFDALDSSDDNGIAGYEWDFDSDGTVDATAANVTTSFPSAGVYKVTVSVIDVAGNRASFADYTLTIIDISPPEIVLEVDVGTTFVEGTTASFDASGSTDASGIEVIRWYLDDDRVPFAVGATASMRFDDPGIFVITVEAIDPWDNVGNRSVELNVTDVTPPEVVFKQLGPIDNTKVEFFILYVTVTDNDEVQSVVLYYKTQDAGVFSPVDMVRVEGSDTDWMKDELAPGGKGNATYYIVATDRSGNVNRTSETSGYQRILVTGVVDPNPSNGDGDGLDILQYWWLLVIVALAVAVAVGIAAARGRDRDETRKPKEAGQVTQATPRPPPPPPVVPEMARTDKDRPLCAIEEVYLIHNDGRLIHSASSSTSTDRDAQDVFAGMFTAIQDFIKDSMARKGDLGSFEYGENRIVIERGRHLTCAATIFGAEPPGLREEIHEVVRQVEGNYAGVIERWDGDKAKLGGINEFASRILGLYGGVDRDTIIRAKEKKGVKLLSEVEFFQGFVRLKVAVKNDTEAVITDAALDVVYDDNVLRIDHIQPVYEYKRGKVHLGNINASEKKTVAFNFDPIICMESNIDGTLTYRDVGGKLQVVSMKTRRADIVCPIFFTRENANTAMLKRLIHEELAAQDSKVFRYPDGLAPSQAFELCKGVVHLHDVKFVREFIEEKPTWLGEAWFYGETKVKGYKIVIRVTVREDSHTAEFFVASSEMEVITGLLAELGHSLNRMLKEKYMGRLKAQPIVDAQLKKDITDQPLLLEREE